MSVALSHPAAKILQRILIALGLGATPPTPGNTSTWPIYTRKEPNSPDNVITIFGTDGQDDGRSQVDGELFCHEGIQVRVRSADPDEGYAKAADIRKAMAEDIYEETATIDGTTYLIGVVSKISRVLFIGTEPTSSRSVYTINALMTVKPTS